MSRPCRIGTPDPVMVAKLRANRATAILRINGPKTGSRSLSGSMRERTASVCLLYLHHTENAMMATTRTGVIQAMFFDSTTRNCVGSGSSLPKSWNIFSNTGTMKMSIATTEIIDITSTTTGYVIADLIVLRSLTSASNVLAAVSSECSRNPPVSPARTRWMNSGGNTSGCRWNDSDRLSPDSTSLRTASSVSRSFLFSVCSERIVSVRMSDSPDEIMVAICRAMIARSLSLTLPPRPAERDLAIETGAGAGGCHRDG